MFLTSLYLQVEPGDAVMAATTSYSAVTKRGWCADLSEKVSKSGLHLLFTLNVSKSVFFDCSIAL